MGKKLMAPSSKLIRSAAEAGGVFRESGDELDMNEGESNGIDGKEKGIFDVMGSGVDGRRSGEGGSNGGGWKGERRRWRWRIGERGRRNG